MKQAAYEVVIIGGGPAGLTAALYAKRAGLKTLVIEKMIVGGQMNLALTVENYPGIGKITGSDLADQMYTQVQNLGVEFLFVNIDQVDLDTKTIVTPELTVRARVIIIATGAGPRKLTAAHASQFANNGIHYCATCDGPLYRGKTVVVVGGGQQALADTLFLSNICQSVIAVNPTLTQPLAAKSNVQVYQHCAVQEILGTTNVTGVKLQNTLTKEARVVAADAVFVALGKMPNIELFPTLALGPTGYVQTDARCATNIAGVYAVGDVREKNCRQIVTAVADGATAATAAVAYLRAGQED